MSKVVVISVRVTEEDLKMMDKLVSSGKFLNRSDLIRTAVRELANRYRGEKN